MMNTKKSNFLIPGVVALAAIVIPFVLIRVGLIDAYTSQILTMGGINAVIAISVNMVTGIVGQLTLGQCAFEAIGAYSVIIFTQDVGLPLPVAMLVAPFLAAIFGFVIGFPTLKLEGDYLAIVTLAFGEIVRNLCMNMPFFGGALGLKNEHTYGKDLYVVAFVTVIVLLIVIQNLVRSKHGRAITAVRDNEIAAKAMGINVTFYKLFAFTIAAFFAGVAGVLYSYTQARVQTSTFDYNYSIEILVMVVLGGMGSINGSILAAALITFINVKLQTVLTGNLSVLQKVIYALILIGIVIYRNAPGLKGFREKYNLNTLSAKLFKKKGEVQQECAEEVDAQ